MRSRLPIAVLAFIFVLALVVSGCGSSDSSSTSSAPTGATQSTVAGATSSSGATAMTAGDVYDKCIAAADKISDNSQQRNAKQVCKDAKNAMEDVSNKVSDATKQANDAKSQAYDACVSAANNLPNSTNKATALAACDKIKP